MATEDILRELPRTEDTRRRVLQWLDMSSDREESGETEGSSQSGSEHANRSTALQGGPNSVENGSTASRRGPHVLGKDQRTEDGRRSTALRGGPSKQGTSEIPTLMLRWYKEIVCT